MRAQSRLSLSITSFKATWWSSVSPQPHPTATRGSGCEIHTGLFKVSCGEQTNNAVKRTQMSGTNVKAEARTSAMTRCFLHMSSACVGPLWSSEHDAIDGALPLPMSRCLDARAHRKGEGSHCGAGESFAGPRAAQFCRSPLRRRKGLQ